MSSMKIAFVREVPDSINECELTFLDRQPIDVENARRQHTLYVELLRILGVEVRYLPVAHDLPDSVFVEDTALVLDEVAVITRPGVPSRRPEVDSAADALGPYRKCERIEDPATVDGGDITVVGKRMFVGSTTRSNDSAIEALGDIVEPFGYTVESIVMSDCLHLKSAVTAIGPNAILLNPNYVASAIFDGMDIVETHPDEPEGANAVLIGDQLVYAAEYPQTRKRLVAAGYAVHTVSASELAKAEGAVTCCSVIFDDNANSQDATG